MGLTCQKEHYFFYLVLYEFECSFYLLPICFFLKTLGNELEFFIEFRELPLTYLFLHFTLKGFLKLLALPLDHDYQAIENFVIGPPLFHFPHLEGVVNSPELLFLKFPDSSFELFGQGLYFESKSLVFLVAVDKFFMKKIFDMFQFISDVQFKSFSFKLNSIHGEREGLLTWFRGQIVCCFSRVDYFIQIFILFCFESVFKGIYLCWYCCVLEVLLFTFLLGFLSAALLGLFKGGLVEVDGFIWRSWGIFRMVLLISMVFGGSGQHLPFLVFGLDQINFPFLFLAVVGLDDIFQQKILGRNRFLNISIQLPDLSLKQRHLLF